MSIQATARYVPSVDIARPRIAVTFPAAPGATAVTVTDLATNLNVAVTAGTTVADVNDANTIHYDTADISGLNLETVGQKQLVIHFTPAAGTPQQALLEVLPADALLLLYRNQAVYLSANGSAGTVIGVNGTPANPSSNFGDAIVLAAALGFARFRVNPDLTGVATPIDVDGDDISGTTVESTAAGNNGRAVIRVVNNPGTDVDGCVFTGLVVEGDIPDMQAGLLLIDCQIAPGATLIVNEGLLSLDRGAIQGTIEHGSAKFLSAVLARGAFFGGPGATATYDFAGNIGFMLLFDAVGFLSLENSPAAGIPVHQIHSAGLQLTIAANNAAGAGTLVLSGVGSPVIDLSAPAFVMQRRGYIDESALGSHVMLDQREYVTDGANQLMIKARRSHFLCEADRIATAPETIGPFVEGSHALAVKTQYVESTVGANPGEPSVFTVRTL